ncbi:MAG TPA: sulfurtransferase TusA family protein [Thermoanaerobaculia bacterium]|nr:sulfurtransferase TusA family protein [Thermoanaerobaculia bacterium]
MTGAGPTGPDRPDLDLRGLFCPLPVLLTDRALSPLAPGARLTVLGDDPAIHGDLPAWCAETGHRLVALEELPGGVLRFVVEKRSPA